MAIDRTIQTKRSGSGATMDSLKVPENINDKLGHNAYRGSKTNAAAEEIFSGNRYSKQTRFGAADNRYEGSERRARVRRDDPIDYSDSFIPKPDPNKKAPDLLHQGVKVGSAYVERKKVIIWITVALVLLISALLFLPPLMNSTTQETTVDHDRNIFQKMGMTEFKTYALSNYSVYSQEAFSSEKNENYRVIEMTVHVQNSSPFQVTIPQYKALYVPTRYEDKVCYVSSAKRASTKDGEGKVVGDVIDGFQGKDVTVELMINVSNMTEEQLDECVTGMVLSTVGAKKKIAKNVYVPCLPALLFVSNAVTVQLDP
ncbi:MAG: hypothetical protein J5582_15915 [Ruminococcus sp.]|uniref:hypothetical protein n=1 Tax=Ruminococcus sp. TaxID=41978 RepID=UPI0025FCF20F|nr:hypothetical protein [Ruminococcus sp.]MBO4868026.1 hypothetical protein [Ruminococcus sp.]